jgi:membrane-bound ClpP family serine protease
MHRLMLTLGFLLQIWGLGAAPASETRQSPPSATGARKVYVIPVREEIGTALVFLIRRGVKQAIEDKAELLVLDMETNGGRVDKTEEIIQILNQFQGRTMTYVNRKAFSAGAFISFATQQIYMAPEAVIGAAAPIMVGAGGGAEKVSEAAEAKMISATAALVRASAEKNGHNVDVAEAMIRRTKELVIEGEVLNRPGELLTLTSRGAEKRYGASSKPLLSSGTYPSLADLLIGTGYGSAERVVVEPTGWEQVGSFLSSQMVSSLLLAIGVIGVYLEFKAPGFGLPGIVGGSAFALYFLGGYLAGLSGAGWVVVFFLGLALLSRGVFLLSRHPGGWVGGGRADGSGGRDGHGGCLSAARWAAARLSSRGCSASPSEYVTALHLSHGGGRSGVGPLSAPDGAVPGGGLSGGQWDADRGVAGPEEGAASGAGRCDPDCLASRREGSARR